MVIKNYTVSLEEDIVEDAKEIMMNYGGKLSPLLNEFLRRFVEEERGKN